MRLTLLLALTACTGGPDDTGVDTADSAPQDSDTDEEFSCPTPEIRVNGDDPPAIGTYWEVFLWCDNTLMTGAMHMSIVPATMATIEDYSMTFNEAGEGVLAVQVGSIRAERAVEVGE